MSQRVTSNNKNTKFENTTITNPVWFLNNELLFQFSVLYVEVSLVTPWGSRIFNT